MVVSSASTTVIRFLKYSLPEALEVLPEVLEGNGIGGFESLNHRHLVFINQPLPEVLEVLPEVLEGNEFNKSFISVCNR